MPVFSFRAASLTTAVALMGAIAGCAVATEPTEEGTGNTSEAMSVIRSTPPPEIWTDTYDGSASACTATDVAIPIQLAGLGCTLGAQYGSRLTAREWAYAWGCPESVVDNPNVIPANGFGLAPPNSAGAIYGESITITFVPSIGAACFGNADFPTKVLVVDTISSVGIKGGCKGGCDD